MIPRLIPASAGNTLMDSIVQVHAVAHPRERGEHIVPRNVGLVLGGSSPRARGTLKRGISSMSTDRLIPASAGNTRCACCMQTRRPAHPRERGEHPGQDFPIPFSNGSSPRARGTQANGTNYTLQQRLIPASAGNTAPACGPSRPRSAHPRERGEHGHLLLQINSCLGSSPRARGTLMATFAGLAKDRLIPASAGNTISVRVTHGLFPAHPRERGEHRDDIHHRTRHVGSSPRARGTQGQRTDR